MTRNSNPKSSPKKWLAACTIAALLTFAASASAQVGRVHNGNALDANNQVGGGGSNAPVPGYVPINGNDIITGNSTGLSYFHGRVGYSNPNTFGVRLPSDALSSFNRASVGGYNPPANTGQITTYYNPSSVVSTANGRINPGLASSSYTSRNSASLTGSQAINPTVAAGANAPMGSSVGIQPTGTPPPTDYSHLGVRGEIPDVDDPDTSSLFGLQRTLLAQPTIERVDPDTGLDTTAAAGTNSSTLEPSGMQTSSRQSNQWQVTNDLNNPNPDDLTTDQDNPNQRKATRPGSPNLLNDQQKNVRLSDAVRTKPISDRAALPKQAGQTLNTVAAPKLDSLKVSASYQKVWDDLRHTAGPGLKYQPAGLLPNGAIPDTTRFALPSDRKLAQATKIDPLTGLPVKTNATNDQSVNPRMASTVSMHAKVQLKENTDNTATTQSSTAEPLSLMPNQKPLPIKDLMKEAEANLGDGKFLEAADVYQYVLRLDPNYKPALIGRAHAELAAGMYESADYDLKFLFQVDPDLVTAHHNLALFLPVKRLNFLEQDLQALTAKKQENPGAFLLSYLYYQTGRTDDLRNVMDVWAVKSPDEPWVPPLRRAWLPEATTQP